MRTGRKFPSVLRRNRAKAEPWTSSRPRDNSEQFEYIQKELELCLVDSCLGLSR